MKYFATVGETEYTAMPPPPPSWFNVFVSPDWLLRIVLLSMSPSTAETSGVEATMPSNSVPSGAKINKPTLALLEISSTPAARGSSRRTAKRRLDPPASISTKSTIARRTLWRRCAPDVHPEGYTSPNFVP